MDAPNSQNNLQETSHLSNGACRYPETEDSQIVTQKNKIEDARKDETNQITDCTSVYRTKLPAPSPNTDLSLWTILKDCIGKDLSSITMPVYFNEPICMLQKIAECFENVDQIGEILNCTSYLEKISLYLNVFLTAQHSQLYRDKKPFNPIIGETYELIDEEKKFRLLTEQVSHHPPISAWQLEGKGFTSWGNIRPKIVFWGKYAEIRIGGDITVLLDNGECLICNIPNTNAHNLVFGKFWSEKSGVMNVRNLMNNENFHVDFKSSFLPGKSPHRIEGYFTDSNGKQIYIVKGKYIETLWASKGKDHPESKSKDKTAVYSAPDLDENSSIYYHFPSFSMRLNQLLPGMEKILPPTDSRFRNDIRFLEEGRIQEASIEKQRLEEKQRAARKEKEKSGKPWIPLWFELRENPYTHQQEWISNGKYWERNYQQCPDLF